MFYTQLEKLCKMNNTTPTALITSLGMGNSNVTRWKNGTMPNSEVVLKLADYFKVTTDYLLTGKNIEYKNIPDYLSEDEILRNYRMLNNQGKALVSTVIAYAFDKKEGGSTSVESNSPDNVAYVNFEGELSSDRKDIAVFFQPAAAGTGTFLDSDDYDMIDVPIDPVTIRASFGVRVSGDSMEPDFEDEDIVFVKQQRTLDSGEIGIFLLNGDAYIKKLLKSKNKYQLVSLNSKYDPKDIHAHDEFRVVGKVIGKLEE